MKSWVVACITTHQKSELEEPYKETTLFGPFDTRQHAFEWDREQKGCNGDHHYWVINDVRQPSEDKVVCIHDDPFTSLAAIVPRQRTVIDLGDVTVIRSNKP